MISEYLGIDSDYLVIGLAALVLILIIIMIINVVQMHKLKKNYQNFMTGKNGKNLEETILKRLDQVDQLIEANSLNQKNINRIFSNMKYTFQKVGLIKYDAFNEMGGKLSFSLALLNETNDGFIINAMHSREGCYTYVKEILKGESYVELAEEEAEALDKAIFENYDMDIKDIKNK